MRTNAALSLLAAALVLASIPAAHATGKAVFVRTVHDAGRVEHGSAFDVDFVVRNEGTVPVNVLSVRPTCGCTVTDYTATIAPGTEGKIHARVETRSLNAGKQAKTITVNTDAPDAERVVLTIQMDLVTALEFLPKGTVFMRTAPGVAKSDQVLARPHRPGMKLTSVKSSNPLVKASMEAAKPTPDKGIQMALLPREGDSWITLTLDANAPEGVHRADITVTTSDPGFPEAQIKVNAVVRGAAE